MGQKNFYCEYCGHKFPNVRLLATATCPRHPDGSNKGYHKLYEGSEKENTLANIAASSFRPFK